VVAIHSVVLAAIASIAAFEALRGRSWDGPSQEDWFCEEEQSQPDRVRAFHVVSLLKQHSNHDDHNERKSLAMMTAQTALVMAAVLTAATILLGRLGF
jgi:hypothetical protein